MALTALSDLMRTPPHTTSPSPLHTKHGDASLVTTVTPHLTLSHLTLFQCNTPAQLGNMLV